MDAAAAVAPRALVGRLVRVLWPDEGAADRAPWFLGRVESYDADTGKHQVD